LTANSLQSADKDQREMRALAVTPQDAVVKFDTCQNVQRRTVASRGPPSDAISRLLSNWTQYHKQNN